jgi:2-iminobutanoate/2-iminopropanoate deaminase
MNEQELDMNGKTIIKTADAPAPVGPYSQGVAAGGWLWTSGQVALLPQSGVLVGSTAAEQADRALQNIEAILASAGCGLERVVRVTMYLTDMDDFSAVNEVYAKYFRSAFPARSCVQVVRLPLGAMVEIDALALLG